MKPDQSTMVVVTCGVRQPQLAWAKRASARWLYLGKDVGKRSVAYAALRSDFRWKIDADMHLIAAELRAPFLDFVADVGELQQDEVAWWSTTFSWKSWGSSDLFLLVCYLRLAQRAIEEALSKKEPTLLLIEDRWLYFQLRKTLGNRANISFVGASNLWIEKAEALAKGVIKRVWWLLGILRRYCRQRGVWQYPLRRNPSKPTIGLYSLPLSRCILPTGEWVDPFLPGLDELLRDNGYEVIRLGPPENIGFERDLAERHEFFQPMILAASLRRVFRAFIAFWKPRWPVKMRIDDLSVDWLARREWWREVSTTALCMYRMYYECLSKILSKGNWKGVVHPYENQPWEKLTALCASRYGMRTIGVQHSALSLYYMSVFLGKGESERMPLPDVVFTSGPYSQRILAEGGYPTGRVRMSGSLRYNYLSDTVNSTLESVPCSEILLALPIDLYMAEHLLDAVRSAYFQVSCSSRLRFYVKEHPSRRFDLSGLGFPVNRAADDVNEALQKCGLVIYVGTTLGPEAVALGRPALRYRPALLLDVDIAEPCARSIPTCDDDTIAESIERLVGNDISIDLVGARDGIKEIFAPLDRTILQDAFPVGGAPLST